MAYNFDEFATHMNALRAMGCAVCVVTPEDIQTLTADENDEPTIGPMVGPRVAQPALFKRRSRALAQAHGRA